MDLMKLTPRSGDQGTKRRGQTLRSWQASFFTVSVLFLLISYLHFLFHIIKDEPLRVDEVIWWVEGDGVERPAVNAASVYGPATRSGPDQTLNGWNESLGRKTDKFSDVLALHMVQFSVNCPHILDYTISLNNKSVIVLYWIINLTLWFELNLAQMELYQDIN